MAEISSEDRAKIAGEVKARIKGITTHEEAKGREGLAEHLAHDTDMSVEAAVGVLKASPKVEAEKPAEDDKGGDESAKGGKGQQQVSHFENAMGNSKHPNVGADGGGDGSGDKTSSKVDEILGAQAAATGRDFRKKPTA